MNDDIILDIQNVTKKFPGVTALSNVSMKVQRGEIHGLCGENGAGKSTLMKILSGVYPYGTYEGEVFYNGEELRLEHSSIRHANELGISIVHQELTLVPSMTVGENVYLGKEPVEKKSINWNKLYSDTDKILARYNLDVKSQAVVRTLGVGKMQMVEIAKALSEDAQVLILDEPTSALNEVEIKKLMEILATLKANGVTIIYITHKLNEFFGITDSVTVLRDGETVTTQPTRNLSEERLVQYMVGRQMKERFPKGNRQPGEVIFEVEDLCAEDPSDPSRMVVNGVSFTLRQGEILGIAGLMGSGRTELVTTIFGEYGKVTSGRLILEGRDLKINSARDAIEHGISLVPEDRKGQGLVLMQSILKNISLPNLNQFAGVFSLDKDAELEASLYQAKSLAIKAPNLQVSCNTLSGGNQQKVVIAKWLMSRPKILIMDDPTRGVDVGAKYEIYKLMNELAERGVSIIMISSELEEVLGMSDRVMVMHDGRSNGTLDVATATQEKIMALATGINSHNHTSN
ncbi:MAG: ATP-binding cassette domain-containing protein [Ardenticatenaceae bacterium]|nr:ATP-binding cassette domain-containing protein [Ardenticatenaceae bacterium]